MLCLKGYSRNARFKPAEPACYAARPQALLGFHEFLLPVFIFVSFHVSSRKDSDLRAFLSALAAPAPLPPSHKLPPRLRQAWPADLPLISRETAADGTLVDQLDVGVIMFSCSFAVILLMILSQVGR